MASIELGVPWQGFVHDLSKFSPLEFWAYARYFKGPYGALYKGTCPVILYRQKELKQAFDVAWKHHQKHNPHHWEHWIIELAIGENKVSLMPEKYVREMVADWMAMSRARGKSDCSEWYEGNKEFIKLHPETRKCVETLIFLNRSF
jgi:hypothetical protein